MQIENVQALDSKEPIELELFWSRISSMQYVFKDGKYAHFVDFKFYTNHPEHVAELKKEVGYGHPHIYQKAGAEKVLKDTDPLAGLKEKIRAEIIAEEKAKMAAAAGTTSREMGTTAPVAFKPLSTTDVASGMADSVGGGADVVGEFIAAAGVNPGVAAGLAAIKAGAGSTAKSK
jgi:hypothetical protein